MRRPSPQLYQLRLSPKPGSRTKKRRKSTRPRKLLTRSKRAARRPAGAAVAGGGGGVTKKNPPRSLRRPRRRPATKQRRTRPISAARAVDAKATKLTATRRVMPSGGAGGAAGEAADDAYAGKTAWNPASKNRAQLSIPSKFCRLPRSKKASRRWGRRARAAPTISALGQSKRRACRLLPAMVRQAAKTSLRQAKVNRAQRHPLRWPRMRRRIMSRRGRRQTEGGRVGQNRRPPPRPSRGFPTPARWNGNSNRRLPNRSSRISRSRRTQWKP